MQPVDWWREQIAVAGLDIISGAVLRNQAEAPMWLYLLCRPDSSPENPG